MGNILKVSHISADVGLDMNVDLIMAGVQDYVKNYLLTNKYL